MGCRWVLPKVRGLFYAFMAAVCWSIGPIFVKFLQNFYGVNTQNAYRFLAAGLLLMLIYLYRERGLCLGIYRVLRKATVAAVVVNIFQTVLIAGIYLTKASTAAFLMRLSAVFVGLMGYIFYVDERKLVKNRKYLVGLVLALAGVSGFTLKFGGGEIFDLGAFLILVSSVLWSFYIILLKKYGQGEDPLLFTSLIFIVGGIMLLPFSFVESGLEQMINAPTLVTLILVFSGLVSIGFSNWSNIMAINRVGAVAASTVQLIQPALTSIFAVMLLGEAIALWEAFFGLVILVGNGLVAYALYES
ncbi:MAG TPA: DMT family transporter [Thermofilum sp.]|nr:DMT family transporter [Thermofilum sp.]